MIQLSRGGPLWRNFHAAVFDTVIVTVTLYHLCVGPFRRLRVPSALHCHFILYTDSPSFSQPTVSRHVESYFLY